MANILELLRSVLTDAKGNAAFREAPRQHLTDAGFADLTGEDVATALDALRAALPAAAANALGALDADRLVAEARPAEGEDELDAAVRVLSLAVDAVPKPRARRATKASQRPTTQAGDAPTGGSAGAEATDRTPRPAPPDLSALPSIDAFRELIEAAASSAVEQAQALTDRIAELFAEVDREVAELRVAAAADVERWRQEAEADREAARVALGSIDADAEALRKKAVANAEQIEADARAGVEAAEAELAARRAELERDEARLQERVANIDTLLKTVLADEPADPGVGSAV